MPSIHDHMRAADLMTDAEHEDLLNAGWTHEVVASLHIRGFRPCKPDYVAARFEGIDIRRTMGFLRQTALPHLHITVARDELPHVVMERIDTAIHDAGRLAGHESLAGHFMRFFDFCKNYRPGPDLAALESRLAKLEARNQAP